MQEIADQKMLPGFSVAVIKDGAIKYEDGFGFADIESKKSYTKSTIQNIGSVSKTFIGVALMKAEELGLLDLDDPINDYLPYHLINPRFPTEKITIRHIASHTSGLNDPDAYERAYVFEGKLAVDPSTIPRGWKKYIKLYNENEGLPIDSFIISVYAKGGEYYRKKNFLRKKPGVQYKYSNIGAGIASRILEEASGMSFSNFTKQYIFDEIGMTSTTWNLDEVKLDDKATPYLTYGQALPHYSLITFADGGLITSIHDLSLYLIEMMKCYEGKGRVLSEEKCKEMMEPYLKDSKSPYGVFWSRSHSGLSIGHNGGDPGVLTNMYFMPSKGIGKIMMVNIMPTDKSTEEAIRNVWGVLKKYEEKI
ncbi:serine hydrolase domain-containing protein [Portibacter lacus]|uniref:serine hydrolase domain-containing protein n=1 Tax=Portibacter lacus TaxID=1099794 RepID=UPI0024E129DE|nr:serine hydrolase domain-containing protein [Portibacter lacus]